MADKNSTYVVNGAVTKCHMGLRESKLVLTNDYGIFIRKKPQVTVRDCKVQQNIIPFGGCISTMNPDTMTRMVSMGMTPILLTASFSARVESAFSTVPSYVAPITCAGTCTPVIVSNSWGNAKEDVEIDGNKTLIGKGTLTCLYGGIITLEDAGQK